MSYRSVGSYYEVPQMSGTGSYYEVPQMSGMGSYFTFRPHEVMLGFGSIAATFSAADVWADVQIVGSCFSWDAAKGATVNQSGLSQGECNNKSQQVNKAVSAALNELGYGPISVDGSISWQGAYSKFLADFGLTKGPGYGLTQQALAVMEQQLRDGKVPGPNPPVKYEKIDKNTYVPTGKPGLAAAGLGTGGLILAALVLGGIGYAAYKSGKKKRSSGGPRRTGSGRSMRLQKRR